MGAEEKFFDFAEVDTMLLLDLLQDFPAGRDRPKPFHPFKGILVEYTCQYILLAFGGRA